MGHVRTRSARMMIAGLGASLLMYAGIWSGAQAQAAFEVPIQAFVFQPVTLSVPAGTTVTWTN